MLRQILRLTDRLEADAVPQRTGSRRRRDAARRAGPDADAPPERDEAAGPRDAPSRSGERRLLMVGGRTERGAWTWMSPELEAAERALPGPWSLTLLLRGRPAGGSPP